MHGADAQKYYQLKARPGQLVTDGFFRYVRNPNYLGELLLYLGMATLSGHWGSLAVVGAQTIVLWRGNMASKDASLARYPEFASWKARTWQFIPLLW